MFKSMALVMASAGIALSAPSYAATTISFTPGGSAPANGQTVVYDFDTSIPASLVTSPLVQLKTAPADPNGAPPANSTIKGTQYLSVLGGGLATILFTGPVSAFSFDWGSIDSYNTLTILPFGGGDSIVIPGTTFTNTAANGNQVAAGTNGLFNVAGTGGTLYQGFTLTSTANSFEIDNVAAVFAVSAIPEPATWAMMMLGVGAIGFTLRRRSKVTTRVTFGA